MPLCPHTRVAASAVLALALSLGAPAPAGADTTYYDNVVVVLDASGSMKDPMGGERKMEAARRALFTVLARVAPTTHVGVLVFPHDKRGKWTYPLGPLDPAGLRKAIERIRPGGGTPLGEFIKLGADRLLEAREAQFGYGSYRLLVVTDGEASDADRVERFTPDVKARGVTLDVIGVAMASEHTLAKYANSYRSADDPESLQRAIAEVFAEVSDKAGAGMTADDAFDLIDGLDPAAAEAMIRALDGSGNHPIGEAAPPRPVQVAVPSQPEPPEPARAGEPGEPAPEPREPAQPAKAPGGRGLQWWHFAAGAFVLYVIYSLRKMRG